MRRGGQETSVTTHRSHLSGFISMIILVKCLFNASTASALIVRNIIEGRAFL
jgi:hypothetical protein